MMNLTLILALVDPCTTQDFKFPEVAWACAEEGRAGAKKLMKEVVAGAKERGEIINCKSCHSDLKSFELKEGSVQMMERWLTSYEENC
jgi:hypothetical protein